METPSMAAAPVAAGSIWDTCECRQVPFGDRAAFQLEVQLWHQVKAAEILATAQEFLNRIGMTGGTLALLTVRSINRKPETNLHAALVLTSILQERYEVVAVYDYTDGAFQVYFSRNPTFPVGRCIYPSKLG